MEVEPSETSWRLFLFKKLKTTTFLQIYNFLQLKQVRKAKIPSIKL